MSDPASSTAIVPDRELPIILGEPHMAYLQAIGRGPTETKFDTRAQCTGCDWQGPQYRTTGPAIRDLLEHEKDTAQAAYGSLKRHHALLLEVLGASVSYEQAIEDVERSSYALKDGGRPEQFELLAQLVQSANRLGSVFREMRTAVLDDAPRPPAAGGV